MASGLSDTYVETAAVHLALLRQAGTDRRLALALTLSRSVVSLTRDAPIRREEMSRRRRARIDQRVVDVASMEDTVLAKLDWFRRGGEVSERQWTDVIGLLRVASAIDSRHLDSQASARGLADLLGRARQESQQP